MNFCPNCGNRVNCKDFFCQYCGYNLKKISENRTLKTEIFQVAGVHYYFENIKKLSCSNPDYRRKPKNGESGKVFRYHYINKPVKLIPEPSNQYDKNAVMVIIAGELVGYVPSDQCSHIKALLSSYEIKYLSAFISGGEYKIISDGKIFSKDEVALNITVKIGYIA